MRGIASSELKSSMFGQTFEAHDLAVIALLVVLEGVLSIDNALVLGLLAKRLPKHQQSKALSYGLIGAFVFRLIAISTAAWLLHWKFVKLLGGGYLIYVAAKHFFFEGADDDHVTTDAQGNPSLDAADGTAMSDARINSEIEERSPVPGVTAMMRHSGFWSTVLVIELTDIAFAVDSILAAIGVVGSQRSKLWVIILGGFLGVVLMRFAAVMFIKMLERFPRFEISAYLLVIVIGIKLILDWHFNPDHLHPRMDFHSYRSPAFWIFWIAMIVCFCIGFIPGREHEPPAPPAPLRPPASNEPS
jgi:YkoY family integral membrane protein